MSSLLSLRVAVESDSDSLPPWSRVPGFNESWWSRSRNGGRFRGECFSAFESDAEVARIFLLPGAPAAAYVGLGRLREPLEVVRFEVAAHRLCEGIGRRTMLLLAERFEGSDFWVHSDEDKFYERLGWTSFERVDGDLGFQTMFVRFA